MKQYLIADHAVTLFIWGTVAGFILAVALALYVGNRLTLALENDMRRDATLDTLLARPKYRVRDADIVVDLDG